jgi:general secretion pathway protein N
MPSKLSWVALGIGAYLAFTLSRFPAAVAYRWFAPPNIILNEVSGTVWSGSADTGRLEGIDLGGLRWRIAAPALLIGRLSVEFEARLNDGFVQGGLTAGLAGLRFTNLSLATTLQNLRGLAPIYAARGEVSAAIDTLEIEAGWPVTAVGEIRIGNLEVAPLLTTGSAALIPLGSFVAVLQERQTGTISAALRDAGGPLELAGSAELTADRSYEIDGQLRPRADAADELIQGVQFMTSEPDAEGWRRITLTGSL